VRDAAVVIVNYRCEAHTLACVGHLRTHEGDCPAETIVVDNSPSELLAQGLVRIDPTVKYLPQSENLGFAGGVNRGLMNAARRFVILLNPDARPDPGCLGGLLDVVAQEGDVVAGPALVPLTPGRPSHPSALRRDPDLWTALVEYTVAHRVVDRSWLDRNYFLRPEDVADSPAECATVQGACLVFPRALTDRVGEFDAAKFFLYWEETDFLRRVRAVGGRVLFCPHLTCRHDGGASMVNGRQDAELFWRGLYRYHRKHSGRLGELLLRFAMLPGMVAELAVLAALHVGRRGGDRNLRRDLETVRLRLREQFRVWPARGTAAGR
jgi:GT2 family glycosyltransferase